MTFHSKLEGFKPPPFKENFRKPPIRKSKFTEEERKQRKREAAKKWAEKNRTLEYTKLHNEKQRAKNTENFQNSIKKARRKILDARIKELEIIAGRPRPLTCEVCNESGKICFDHCHTNNHFRGWLCDRCNRLLGQARDNPDLLRKLIIYLENDKLKSTT